MHETVPQRQGIVGADLVIRARITSDAALRDSKDIGERINDAECGGVKDRPVDNGSVVNGVPAEIGKERSALAYWPTQVRASFFKQKRRLLRRVRITRIPEVVSVIEKSGAVKLICSRPGQYLDPSRANSVVFRGEWILINADLANGFPGAQLAAAESINKNGGAARSCAWSLPVARRQPLSIGYSRSELPAES